jgi:hypothetical protein
MPVKSVQYFAEETCGRTKATFPICADFVKENMLSEYQSY